jgi:hypothetical protein
VEEPTTSYRPNPVAKSYYSPELTARLEQLAKDSEMMCECGRKPGDKSKLRERFAKSFYSPDLTARLEQLARLAKAACEAGNVKQEMMK